MLETLSELTPGDFFPTVRRGRLDTLQGNLGYRCNQQYRHCHVNADPPVRRSWRPRSSTPC